MTIQEKTKVIEGFFDTLKENLDIHNDEAMILMVNLKADTPDNPERMMTVAAMQGVGHSLIMLVASAIDKTEDLDMAIREGINLSNAKQRATKNPMELLERLFKHLKNQSNESNAENSPKESRGHYQTREGTPVSTGTWNEGGGNPETETDRSSEAVDSSPTTTNEKAGL